MKAATLAENLDTTQLLSTLIAFKKGNFSVRMPADRTGVAGKVCDVLNDIFEQNERMKEELHR